LELVQAVFSLRSEKANSIAGATFPQTELERKTEFLMFIRGSGEVAHATKRHRNL